MKIRYFATLFAALAALWGAWTPAGAQGTSAETAHAIIERMLARNPSLQTFQARVHVNVRMLSFPFLSPKLDGTSYFKRPDNYEVVFDRVPGYAKGFQKLFADIGDPAGWERKNVVTFAGEQNVDGRTMLVLQLRKIVHSDVLDRTLVYVDPTAYQVAKMEWHYTNGGIITMTQTYTDQGGYSVIASQHADIRIPHVRAVADATYGQYQTNVAISDAVFSRK